jgi:hypothetical protein
MTEQVALDEHLADDAGTIACETGLLEQACGKKNELGGTISMTHAPKCTLGPARFHLCAAAAGEVKAR